MNHLKVFLLACVLVMATSFTIPIGTMSLFQQLLNNAAQIVVSKFVEPQGQVMVKHMIAQYIGPLAMRELTSAHIFACGVLVVLVIGISFVDAALDTFNRQLADQAKVSRAMIEHYTGGQYDQAIMKAGAASTKQRPKLRL